MTDGTLPRIAVCLAAYNGVRYLRQQLDSIFAQHGVDVTVFASVDQSTDGTVQWLLAYQERQPHITILPYGERFGGAAQNFFRLIRDVNFEGFEYVAFADQDDIWLPNKLIRAVSCMTERNTQGYSSDVIAFWESGQTRYIRKAYPQRRWDYFFESAGPGCTFVLSKPLTLQLQGFLRAHRMDTADIGLHDWFTYAFARSRDIAWHIDNQANLMYRQHSENQVGVNAGWRAFLWRAKQVLNGWGLNQARKIAGLVAAPQDPFVTKWIDGGRGAVLSLLLRSGQCRRRPVDRIWFAASCAALLVLGWE